MFVGALVLRPERGSRSLLALCVWNHLYRYVFNETLNGLHRSIHSRGAYLVRVCLYLVLVLIAEFLQNLDGRALIFAAIVTSAVGAVLGMALYDANGK